MKYEIFSPAGSIDALKKAISSEADVVYLGVEQFNARMNADNFTIDNLSQWVNYAHLCGTKIYLTVNTSIKEYEILNALKIIKKAYEINVDGFIITDLGLIDKVRKIIPDANLIASTQLNINNLSGAKFLENIGMKSIVLARETGLNEIKNISENSTLILESFVHGAMCVSQSGQCLFSSLVDCTSGNRGLCAQPCRQKYTCYDKLGNKLNYNYLLSMKDLCLIDKLEDLKSAGISCFKIEGRSRRPEYVAQVTLIYKKVLKTKKSSENDISLLKTIFNRGDYTLGYAFETDKKSLLSVRIQGHCGLKIGTVKQINKDILTAYFGAYCPNVQDAYKIIRNNKEVGNAIAKNDNGVIQLHFSGAVKVGDDIHITTDMAQINALQKEKKLTLNIDIKAVENEKMLIKMYCLGFTKEFISDFIIQSASNQPVSENEIKSQFCKFDETIFSQGKINITTINAFIVKSKLNEFRRNCLTEFFAFLCMKLNAQKNVDNIYLEADNDTTVKTIVAKEQLCLIFSKLTELNNIDLDKIDCYIYKPTDYNKIEDLTNVVDMHKCYLDMPSFSTDSEILLLSKILKTNKFCGIVANNIAAVQLAKDINLEVFLGQGMNTYNSSQVDMIETYLNKRVNFMYSAELSLKEISQTANQNGFIYVFGELVIMNLNHCPIQLNYNCNCTTCKYKDDLRYVDDKNNDFTLSRKKLDNCYFELKNGKIMNGTNNICTKGNFVINAINIESKILNKVIEICYNTNNNIKNIEIISNNDYTTGHLVRSVK